MRTKRTVAASLAFCLLLVIGCNALEEVQRWMPVALQAFSQIVAILVQSGAMGTPASAALNADAATVQHDFGDLKGLVDAYASAPGDQKQGALSKVLTALDVLSQNLQKLEADVHIGNVKTQQTIQLALGSLMTTLEMFKAQLGPVSARKGAKMVPPNTDTFKAQFNSIMLAGGFPDATLK